VGVSTPTAFEKQIVMDLDALREREARLAGITPEFMSAAIEFATSGPIPRTANVFLSFITRTEFIKNGILDLVETDNTYAMKILFRSLIEHVFRFQYIWLRVCEEKNDEAAEEYLRFSEFKEGILIGKSWKRIAKILGLDSPLTAYDAFRDIVPEAGSYSAKEIDQKTAQVDFANLIQSVFERLKLPRDSHNVPFPLTLIPEYCDLSGRCPWCASRSSNDGGPGR
jgi:hypothetical protein